MPKKPTHAIELQLPKKATRKPDGRAKTNKQRTEASAQQLAIAQRRAKVSQLIILRYSHSQIAETLKCSKGTVQNDVDAIMLEWSRAAIVNIHEYYLSSVARLDYEQQVIATKIQAGDLSAIALDLQIEKRRAALMGLDADHRAKSGMRIEPPEPPIEVEHAEVLTSDGRPVGKGDAARIFAAFAPKDPKALESRPGPATHGPGAPPER